MPNLEVKPPEAVIQEFLAYLSKIIGTEAKLVRKAYNDLGRAILYIQVKGCAELSQSQDGLCDASLTGCLYREAAIRACAMTGKTLEQLGVGDIFERIMQIGDRSWTRQKETGHTLTEPDEDKRLESFEDLIVHTGQHPADLSKAERLDVFSGPIEVKGANDPVKKDLADGIHEAEAELGSGNDGAKRGRGRPKGRKQKR